MATADDDKAECARMQMFLSTRPLMCTGGLSGSTVNHLGRSRGFLWPMSIR